MRVRTRTRATAGVAAVWLVVAVAGACGGGPTPTSQPQAETPTPAGPVSEPPAALPDFVITGVRREPPEGQLVAPGTTVYFHVSVTNQGTADYGAYIVVQGPGNHTGGFSGLAVGETKEAAVELGVRTSGGETVSGIYLRIDPDNVTPEENEGNNEAGPFTVEFGG